MNEVQDRKILLSTTQLKITDEPWIGSQSRYRLLAMPLQTSNNLDQLLCSQNAPSSELSGFTHATELGHRSWTGQNVANHLRKVWRKIHCSHQPVATEILQELNVSTNHGTLTGGKDPYTQAAHCEHIGSADNM